MAQKTLKADVIKLKRKSNSTWGTTVLKDGEVGFEVGPSSTTKMKVGTGSAQYSALPYCYYTPAETDALLTNYLPLAGGTITGNIVTKNLSEGGLSSATGAANIRLAAGMVWLTGTEIRLADSPSKTGTARLRGLSDATAETDAVNLRTLNAKLTEATANYLPLTGGTLTGPLKIEPTSTAAVANLIVEGHGSNAGSSISTSHIFRENLELSSTITPTTGEATTSKAMLGLMARPSGSYGATLRLQDGTGSQLNVSPEGVSFQNTSISTDGILLYNYGAIGMACSSSADTKNYIASYSNTDAPDVLHLQGSEIKVSSFNPDGQAIKITNVATPTDVNDVSNKGYVDDKIAAIPTYTLPIASSTVLGGFKVGSNLTMSADGVLSAPTPGISQADADSKYLSLTGGTVTGTLNLTQNNTTFPLTPSLVFPSLTIANSNNMLRIYPTDDVASGIISLMGMYIDPLGITLNANTDRDDWQSIKFSGNLVSKLDGMNGSGLQISDEDGTNYFSFSVGNSVVDTPRPVRFNAGLKTNSFSSWTGDILTFSGSSGGYLYLNGVNTPISDYEAANKLYVDTAVANLPIASTTTLGTVKIGSGITAAADGTISTTGLTLETGDARYLQLTGGNLTNPLSIVQSTPAPTDATVYALSVLAQSATTTAGQTDSFSFNIESRGLAMSERGTDYIINNGGRLLSIGLNSITSYDFKLKSGNPVITGSCIELDTSQLRMGDTTNTAYSANYKLDGIFFRNAGRYVHLNVPATTDTLTLSTNVGGTDLPVALKGIKNPIDANDATNKTYVDSLVSNYLPLTGGSTTGTVYIHKGTSTTAIGVGIMTDSLSTISTVRGTTKTDLPLAIQAALVQFRKTGTADPIIIKGIATPTADTDAANKAYVDASSGTITTANIVNSLNWSSGGSTSVPAFNQTGVIITTTNYIKVQITITFTNALKITDTDTISMMLNARPPAQNTGFFATINTGFTNIATGKVCPAWTIPNSSYCQLVVLPQTNLSDVKYLSLDFTYIPTAT